MTRESIATDMDEVLTDTLGEITDAVNFRADLGIKMEALNGQKLEHIIPEHDELTTEVLREPGFFKHLRVMPHTQEVIKKLIEHYNVYIATTTIDVPTSFSDKYEWLLEFFPFLNPQHPVFCGGKDIVKAGYLMDDNPRQLEIFTDTPVMFITVHNINDDRLERVNSRRGVEQCFLDNIKK